MPDNHPGTSNSTVRLIKRKSAQMFARGALAVTLSAAMGAAMIPTQAIAEGLDAATTATEQKAASTDSAEAKTTAKQDAKSTAEVASAQKKTATGEKNGSSSSKAATSKTAAQPATKSTKKVAAKVQAAAADETPTFDPKTVVYNAGDVSMTVDGKSEGTFSVFQVATSWVAGTPKKDADGNWTCTLTIIPKDENKIAGHFGDSGYELDTANSKLTVTYHYNKWSGWHAFDKADRATLAYKKAEQAPAFDVTKQDVHVVVYDADEFDPAYETTKPLSTDVATVGKVYKKGDKWAVDVTLKQGTAKDYGVADHTTKGVYLFDDANSVTEVTYITSSLKTADWKPEGDAAKVAFSQVAAPTSDDIVNAQVTVKTTDGSKEKNYYLGAGTYEVGPVTMGYTNPMCVVTLKADKQQSYVDEFNAEKDANGTYELAAKPNDIQFYFSYDPDTQEWTNTTTDQYIYVKKAETEPVFDKDAVNEAGDVKLLLDGEDQGNFSVSQVADSWTASEPKKDADGTWIVDVTFVPKDENKIAGHFGDSGYELDSANSKLTVTYEYNKNSGWHAFDKSDRGTLAFKKADQTPTFEADQAVNQAGTVDLLLNGANKDTLSIAQVADSWTASEPKKDADGNWTVDLTFVPKAENKIVGHEGDTGYSFDAANSKLTVTFKYEAGSKKVAGWKASKVMLAGASVADTSAGSWNALAKGVVAYKQASTTPTNPTDNNGKSDNGNKANNGGSNAKVTPKAQPKAAAKASAATKAAKASSSKSSVPKTGDNHSLAGMATAGVLGMVSLLIAAVEKLHDLRDQAR